MMKNNMKIKGKMKKQKNRVVSNGIRDGYWKEYYSDGITILMEGNYKKGRKHGSWKEYYRCGALYAEGKYYYNVKHGVWIEYRENGTVAYTMPYQKGLRHGNFKGYSGDILIERGSFKDDRPIGLWEQINVLTKNKKETFFIN